MNVDRGTIQRNLNNKTRRDVRLKLYKTIAVTCGCQAWFTGNKEQTT